MFPIVSELGAFGPHLTLITLLVSRKGEKKEDRYNKYSKRRMYTILHKLKRKRDER
jgi:hypothetical protein